MLSKSNPEIIQQLDNHRNKIHSHTGGWIPGKGVFSHGYSMLDELVGEKSYFQIMILNATGRLVERRLADWIEAIYGCLSWPDPRIWCNQIGALAGVARTTTVAATTIGVLAADSKAYGIMPLIAGAEFIQMAYNKYSEGQSVKKIIDTEIKNNKGKLNIMGYKRPIAKGDERIEIMEKVTKNLGFQTKKHMELAYLIEDKLIEDFNERMNINGFISAFLSDENFSENEIYRIFSTLVMSGITACYLEQYNKDPDHFLPLHCDDIEYTGLAYRPVAKKEL